MLYPNHKNFDHLKLQNLWKTGFSKVQPSKTNCVFLYANFMYDAAAHPLVNDNQKIKNGKKKFYFAFFSKLVFRVSKTSFTPLISAILSPIGLKIFLVGLQLI
jgi:hypothetical protein